MFGNRAKDYFNEANKLQYKSKRFSDANSFYLKAISIEPDFIDALNNYAQNLRLNIKDYNLAIEYYSKVIELNPLYENAYFRRGICKGMLNDLQGQVYDYSKHIEINKPKADNFISRILINLRLENYLAVKEDCKIILSLKPNHPFATDTLMEIEKKYND
jgi:tetratricopeptide (TPR) repeat protein